MSRLRRASVIAVTAAAITLGITACSADGNNPGVNGPGAAKASQPAHASSPKPTPVSLDGKWKQTNSASSTAWQAATISGTTIEVDWVSDNGATTSLYWAGSVTPPTTSDQTFTWTSNNDTAQTANALLASSDATKDFTYDHGTISYSVSALGKTMTVQLAREK